MEKRKNIILFMTDEHRDDYVGYCNQGKIQTPGMDRIAEGCWFSSCQTSNPICAPARTALVTGRYPHQIGTLAMFGDLHPQIPTFMHGLREEGYYTAASGKLHFLAPWGMNTPQGKIVDLVALKEQIKEYGYDDLWECAGKQLMLRNYCDYSEHLERKNLLNPYLQFVNDTKEGEEGIPTSPNAVQPSILPTEDYVDILTADKALEFLKNRPAEKPFYLFVSFCGPHMPFDPPKEWMDRVPYEEIDDFTPGEIPLTVEEKKSLWKKRQAYKAMILLIDSQILRILDYLEEETLMEDTILMLTSDHGEMLGDHRLTGKAVAFRESSTVPLAIRHPDYLKGICCESPVSNIDLAATILDAAGIGAERLTGKGLAYSSRYAARSLLPIIRGEAETVREFSFTEFGKQWQMLQTKEWKYIKRIDTTSPEERKEQLYYLSSDPKECYNVAEEEENQDILEWFRRRREFLLDNTQAIQTCWAPVNLPIN